MSVTKEGDLYFYINSTDFFVQCHNDYTVKLTAPSSFDPDDLDQEETIVNTELTVWS